MSPVMTDASPFAFQDSRSEAFVCAVLGDVKMETLLKDGCADRMEAMMYLPMLPVAPKTRMFEGLKVAIAIVTPARRSMPCVELCK